MIRYFRLSLGFGAMVIVATTASAQQYLRQDGNPLERRVERAEQNGLDAASSVSAAFGQELSRPDLAPKQGSELKRPEISSLLSPTPGGGGDNVYLEFRRHVMPGVQFAHASVARQSLAKSAGKKSNAPLVGAVIGAIALPLGAYVVIHDRDSGGVNSGGVILLSALGGFIGYMIGLGVRH